MEELHATADQYHQLFGRSASGPGHSIWKRLMSTVTAPEQQREKRFDWPVCYRAEELLLKRCDEFLARNGFARELARRMREETGTLVLDWVDYVDFPSDSADALSDTGFVEDPLGETTEYGLALHHPSALLPRVLLTHTG